jgi:hypothetical protein
MIEQRRWLFGPVTFWTVLTTVFAWLPLVRIMGRPEGYRWSILGLSGAGTEGPYWVFILLTLYALTLLFSAYRGPRALFYPMLILWHLAVTTVVITSTVVGGSGAVWQGQGLHWSIPMWLLVVPCATILVLSVLWTVLDSRAGGFYAPTAWTRANSGRLAMSLLLLILALLLFRAGTNYDWVTAAAIITTILHWILLAESFQPVGDTVRKV